MSAPAKVLPQVDATPVTDASDAEHARLSAAAAATLRATRPTLRNGVSAHRCPGNLAFNALRAFMQRAKQALGATRHTLYIGSIDGEIIVSARMRATCTPTADGGKRKAKRGRDDCAERAEQAVASIRKRVRASTEPSAPAQLAAVERARGTIEALLRDVKGPRDEALFESCGLSLSSAPASGGAATAPIASGGACARPRLIIACRLSAGVPLPLGALEAALGESFDDGMLTAKPETLDAAYQLPLTAAGRAVEAGGQRSLLLFAAVPIAAQTAPQG